MRRGVTALPAVVRRFVRAELRVPLTLVLIVTLPPVFVLASASVLSTFARALGGELGARAATTLGAAWAAAFIAGVLGFFETRSSRDADRRLAQAGLGALSTALARLGTALLLCLVVTAAAITALRIKQPIPHLWHVTLGVLAFSAIYIAVGTTVGALVRDELAGSLLVVLVFILDVFSGPGMSPGTSGPDRLLTPSWYAGQLVVRAGAGINSGPGDWRATGATVAIALAVALGVFWMSARRRT